ncbi:hypothetical protein TH63_12225 [Rufibacter radiotolerans]|uniref:DUF2642 domain-containing protein n=1 Tax=Rufibacter radiotolerans TaxID=1379910 RepID=A0A0H4VLJ4_9BACT|nr:hypothetical protein [Rufibacter radiotolerans]AKQ46213.1 hypothetical protein TH63_12225 [Rufibacter radiotolerans]
MGKRQRRIFRSNLEQEYQAMLGKDLQLITTQGRVLSGTLESFLNGMIALRDGRRFLHHLPLAYVEEVVLDVEASQ